MKHMRYALAVIAALALSIATPALAQEMQADPYSYLSLASNNSTLVTTGPVLLQNIMVVNTTTTIYYLKLYNTRVAPVCGTDTPAVRLPIPANTSGGGFAALGTGDMKFPFGIGFCLVANIADNDNTVAAAGVAINFGIVRQ